MGKSFRFVREVLALGIAYDEPLAILGLLDLGSNGWIILGLIGVPC